MSVRAVSSSVFAIATRVAMQSFEMMLLLLLMA
jgi:hypothetical protein